MNKSEIRKKILKTRKKRNLLNFKLNFGFILKILKKNNIKGKKIGGYYPYNFEIDCLDIIKKFEKKKYIISLPKIKKDSQMNYFSWSTKSPLILNKYGIPEPISKKIVYPDILLVPIVAFDKYLNRVGYGGGFYDRYLKRMRKKKKIFTIGFAYSFQEISKIQIEKFDMKLDTIITEKKII